MKTYLLALSFLVASTISAMQYQNLPLNAAATFALLTHSRCGSLSPYHKLSREIIRTIGSYLINQCETRRSDIKSRRQDLLPIQPKSYHPELTRHRRNDYLASNKRPKNKIVIVVPLVTTYRCHYCGGRSSKNSPLINHENDCLYYLFE